MRGWWGIAKRSDNNNVSCGAIMLPPFPCFRHFHHTHLRGHAQDTNREKANLRGHAQETNRETTNLRGYAQETNRETTNLRGHAQETNRETATRGARHNIHYTICITYPLIFTI